MKVECQYCGGYGATPTGFGMMEEQGMDKCPECEGIGMQDVDIPTPALIEELEKRRPCERCGYRLSSACMNCTWRDVWGMAGLNNHKDNFKEANHGKV